MFKNDSIPAIVVNEFTIAITRYLYKILETLFQINYIFLWINYFRFPYVIAVYIITLRFPLTPLTLNIISHLFYFNCLTCQLLITV